MATNNFLPAPICEIDDIFCGCGEPELAWKWIRDYLMMLVEWEGRNASTPIYAPISPVFKPNTGPEYISVYMLGHFGLTEHGTSIRVSWITDKGLMVLGFLLRNGYDWCDHEWIDADGVHRGTIE